MSDVKSVTAAFRSEVFDPELPGNEDSSESLWTDADIKRYMTTAQNEFCRATFCLSDPRSYKPAITAGDNRIKASDRIVKPRRAFLQSSGAGLHITTGREMDEGQLSSDYGISVHRDWRADGVTGTPRILITDEESGYYTLYPTPVANDVCQLVVYRLPKAPIYDGGVLEIPEEYRLKLITGMKAQAYLKMDEETHDEDLALKYKTQWLVDLQKFTAEFKQARKGPHKVRYGGIRG